MRNRLEMCMDVLYNVSSQCGNGAYVAKPTRVMNLSRIGWDETLLFLDFLAERKLVKKEAHARDRRSREGYVMEETGKKLLKTYGLFKEAGDGDTARDAYIDMCKIAGGVNISNSLDEAFMKLQK